MILASGIIPVAPCSRSASRFFRQSVQQCFRECLHLGCAVLHHRFMRSAASVDHRIKILIISRADHNTPTHVLRVACDKVLCRVAALT